MEYLHPSLNCGERQVTKPERPAESLGQYLFKVTAFPQGQPPFHGHFILLLERKPFLHSTPPPELLGKLPVILLLQSLSTATRTSPVPFVV